MINMVDLLLQEFSVFSDFSLNISNIKSYEKFKYIEIVLEDRRLQKAFTDHRGQDYEVS